MWIGETSPFGSKWYDGIIGSIPCSCIECIIASVPLVRFPDCHECQSGERTPPERGILLRRLLAVKKWLEPPHMTHIVGFCSMWRMPGSCQNLEKSIQVAARADLAPPPVCPLFWSFCFYWISLYLLSDLWPQVISYLLWHVFSFFLSDFSQSAIGFAARNIFAFVTTSHQLLQGNTAAFKHEFISYSCIEQMK